MGPDDDVCLCFHVPLRKVQGFLKREDPPVASLISECLGAGTGCGWCVRTLKELHEKHRAGEAVELDLDAAAYREGRRAFRGQSPRVEGGDDGEDGSLGSELDGS